MTNSVLNPYNRHHQVYSLGILTSIDNLLRLGLSKADLFVNTELTMAQLTKPEALIFKWQEITLYKNALQLTGNPALGLTIWQGYHINILNMLGLATSSAATLGEALAILIKYQHLTHSYATLSLTQHNGLSHFNIDENTPHDAVYRLLQERDVAIGTRDIPLLIGDKSIVSYVNFNYSEPDYAAEYRQHFNCPIFFDQAHTSIVFTDKSLSLPLKMANAIVNRNSIARCEQELQRLSPKYDFSSRVLFMIDNGAYGIRAFADIARSLYMSPRTLHRKLKTENSNYQQMLQAVRLKQACALLKEGQLNQEQMAKKLGYSDAANFSNAFKRWTGTTPKKYKNQKEFI